MSVAFLLIVLFGLLLVGVPVAISLGVSAVITMLLFSSYDVMGVPEIMLNGLKPALMAIPMFILAGSLMSKGSSAQRIVDFARSIVGHLPGGLPMSAILALYYLCCCEWKFSCDGCCDWFCNVCGS